MRIARSLSILSACLVAISGLAGYLSAAAAQQPEKRIALVVGNAAYAKSPLPTAANDAGLIAQTLQAAGFDVIGARDLDGDTLRKSFRDFIQKAESSGPDTVAMVYLAGYGLQLAGENYFVPVDSAINRDIDVPIEALRTGDYIRQLASLPLKAGIVVLDAARQQPFVNGQIASGLALVEADPHMLIAFNAAPGTVAPAEQGPYGVYAQSLAEMIRTGGLPLPEVFNRVRLRVNEASKGAQVPWDSQKVDAAFTFFERGPDAPAAPPPDQVAAIRSKPIRDLGVQDAYAAVLERDTLPAYEDFLAAYPDDPMAKRVRAIAAARREAITWRRTYRADTPNAYWSYLQRYPRGPHAADARRRLAILTAALEPPPAFDVIDYDVPPPPPEEFIYVDRPVLAFGDPEFDFVAPPPAPVYYLPPPPDDFVILEPPPPPIGLFILPQPIFVPIPIYVRAPRYVAPPPNNIIFANIHNRAVINNVINRRPQPASPAAGPDAGRLGANAIGRPGSPGATVAPGQGGGATPTLPPAVAQRATLIQQGKAPVPPSATINPAVRTGLPGAPAGQTGRPNATQPVNAPGTLPSNQTLPRTNALPVPGARGTPPAPPSAAVSPSTVNPNAKLAPGGSPPTAPGAAAGSRPAIGATAPAAPAGQPRVGVPPPSAAAPPRPAAAIAPKPQLQPELRRAPPPAAVHVARPSPPPAARVAPAPPRMAAPPPRMATPSPPPRMAAPPPRMAAPPPPRMAAPPPPRMAAPPPPRMAAPPPPRMAAPPPRPAPPPAAAARKCPPGARC
ncbi:caspase family protein [Bradyrhizobium sp. AUGA SZCCT0283]|uniref:caspase family protein n=1 Tax=Bradyrhizobium sp. AUGA SZCCT0283 TaxID=2807671 RepID=UPI001BAA0867|nr:caspase family protein [Bradyrhizobium sp. AUGA SZCCT0283]MBR1275427.1 caspase family protein [Bradyrhizobium sp. AUGA SZCCT0283]